MMLRTNWILWVPLFCGLLLSACGQSGPARNARPGVPAVKPPAQAEQPAANAGRLQDLIYVVGRGDTLSAIAEETTGDPGYWFALAQHNGIADPTRLEVGEQIIIPGELALASMRQRLPKVQPPRHDPPALSTRPTAGAVIPEPAGEPVETASGTESNAEPVVEETGWIIIQGSYYPREIKVAPEIGAETRSLVSPGTRLQYLGRPGGWYKVMTDRGEGYISPRDARPAEKEDLSQR